MRRCWHQSATINARTLSLTSTAQRLHNAVTVHQPDTRQRRSSHHSRASSAFNVLATATSYFDPLLLSAAEERGHQYAHIRARLLAAVAGEKCLRVFIAFVASRSRSLHYHPGMCKHIAPLPPLCKNASGIARTHVNSSFSLAEVAQCAHTLCGICCGVLVRL